MKCNLPSEMYYGELEQVFAFYGAMPTGVTVSEDGRIFVNFPKWGDKVEYSVAELIGDKLCPYPDMKTNIADYNNPSKTFISVQSVIADGQGRLWILDTAAPNFSKPVKGGAKLVSIDLTTNKINRIYTFDDDVVLDTTYLNDVRFDYRVGRGGCAYITDSSSNGPGAIIVVDLYTGQSFRRLSGTKSTSPDPCFVPKVEGEIMCNRNPDCTTSPALTSADGIAISPDGKVLYYCPLSSRKLYAISTEILRNTSIPECSLYKYVKYMGEKGASDGMITDIKGAIYAGDYEHNSISKILPNGSIKTIEHSPYMLWPDTLSIGPDGYLYFIVNQLHRQAKYHYGQDLRVKPYSLFRININELPAPTN